MPQEKHFHRRNLPHLYYNEGIYFVTYRLYDSIHPTELEKLQKPLNPETDEEKKKFFKKYDALLDRPYNNVKYLLVSEIAEICKNSILHFDGNDIVSAFFYARTLDYSKLKVGDKIPLKNFYKDKVYDLDVVYHGKETIEVEAGKFECIMVEPLVQEGGLFKSEGSIMLWMTNDEAKMPVRVKTKVVVGAIDADLTSYKGVYGKLTSKKK